MQVIPKIKKQDTPNLGPKNWWRGIGRSNYQLYHSGPILSITARIAELSYTDNVKPILNRHDVLVKKTCIDKLVVVNPDRISETWNRLVFETKMNQACFKYLQEESTQDPPAQSSRT